ncbi:acrosomal protein KIAA1210 homolog isoform X2 [Hyla sarda]|uniref:acrosomal protein KIAA1210 homolog isoform X2 n=1 Tax=Hyla sarda TaxID=327740 RepID=UPI0024C46D1B|nr:acrosomal protein KIAA1210 homolog isoform X2 [Hyla sarda]
MVNLLLAEWQGNKDISAEQRPIQHNRLELDAIMAANTSDATRTVEPEETHEECSGKKKSKFQAFKKLFVKKKRKEPTTPSRESNLKPCQSSSDISASTANTTPFQVDHEAVAKGNMGNKAVSHDSVFVSEMESSVKEDISQECTPGKVKALQLQLQQNIRIGSPPQGIIPKKLEDPGALSEDDGLPRSPPEITSLHEILAHSSGKSFASAQRRSSISLGGTDSEDEPESSELSSRPTSPLPSIALSCSSSPVSHFPFTSPPSSVTCLDNSAAKHRILIKPKKRRAPTMNVKPKQTTDEIDKPVPEEKEQENYDMIEEQQPVKIPGSEKKSAEQKAPSEEVKHLAGVVRQKLKENMNVSVCEQESPSKNTNISFPLEASLLENQSVSFQNEAVFSESDVDFHESLLSTGDQMDITEDDSERDDVNALLQTCDFQPMYENNITVMVKTTETKETNESPESNTSPIENPDLITSQGLVCGALGTYKPNQEEAEAPTVSEIKDEEYNGHENICSDIQSDLLNVTESEFVASETLQNCILSVEPLTAMIKDEDIQEVQVSPECVGSYESDNEDHLGTIDIIQNAAIILDVSDQLVANDEVKDKRSSSEQNTETSDWSITESSDERPDTDNVTDSKAYAVTTNAKDFSYTKVSTNTHDFGIQANSKTFTETVKEIKPAEPTSNSNVKGPNKPVRFTVAPAWQRALSSGSNIKDSPFIKHVEGNITSESSDGAEESIVHGNSSKENVQKNKEESCGHFGVRLRRTSSSIKYSEDHQEEVSRQDLSPVDTSSLSPGRNLHTPKRQHVNTDCAKMSQMSSAEEKSTPESRNQPKPRAEDHIPQENSEPAWITMAKLKQKGFQEHPLAREQSSITEHKKIEETECIQKKYIVTNPQEEEKRCEQAAESPAESEVAQPVSEMSTHSPQPPNPDEPPWFSLAKKKAKAWSEMPQIVQQL